MRARDTSWSSGEREKSLAIADGRAGRCGSWFHEYDVSSTGPLALVLGLHETDRYLGSIARAGETWSAASLTSLSILLQLPVTTADPRLPATTSVGRTALSVTELAPMIAFYRTVVGLAVQSRSVECATLGAGGVSLLELTTALEAGERQGAGLFHVAFRFPSRVALGEALDRVRTHGELDGATDHGVSEALYLRDPEDNGVELYRDRPRGEWPVAADGRLRMETDPLDLAGIAEAASELSTSRPAQAPPGTDVGHVHLEVTDLERARRFYVETLGLNVRQTMGEAALFLAAGDYHHHVGLNTWNGRTEPSSGRGLSWVELRVPESAAVVAARQRFADAGVEVDDRPGGIEVADPDGIRLRLVAASS